jgi:hypothetical protein
VHQEKLGKHLTDRHSGVEGGVRVLKDHLDATPIVSGPFLPQRAALEAHLARCRAVEADNAPAESRLAAARLAHQTQGFTGEHIKVDPINGAEHLWLALPETA